MPFQVVKLVDSAIININLNQSPTVTALIYGDGVTDGSWRTIVIGTDLVDQRLESGIWVEKRRATA